MKNKYIFEKGQWLWIPGNNQEGKPLIGKISQIETRTRGHFTHYYLDDLGWINMYEIMSWGGRLATPQEIVLFGKSDKTL